MRRWVALLAWLVAGCATGAPAAESPPKAVVADVLDLAGIREGAQALEGALRRVVTSLSGAQAFGDAKVAATIVDSVITADRVHAAIAAYAEAHYDAGRFDRVRTLLRQPLNRRMTALEIASTTASPEMIAAWRLQHAATDDGRARLALARRIDVATGSTDATMGMLFGAARGLVRALTDGAPPAGRAPLDRITEEMAKLEPETREYTVTGLAYTYRDVSLADITTYAESLETDLGRWFSALQREAAIRAAEDLSEAAIRRVMDARRAPRV